MRITAETLDFTIDASATPRFSRSFPQESAYSCRQWLALNPMEFEIGAESDITIRYTIRVPATARDQSYQCAAGFTTRPIASKTQATGLSTAVRIVSAFYVMTGKPTVDGTVKSVKLEYLPDQKDASWRAVVVLENRGCISSGRQGAAPRISLAANGSVGDARFCGC